MGWSSVRGREAGTMPSIRGRLIFRGGGLVIRAALYDKDESIFS